MDLRSKQTNFSYYDHPISHRTGLQGKPVGLTDWFRARKVREGNVPAGWTCKRPNDRRMYNFIFRWKYDIFIQQMGNKVDFRSPAADTKALTVLAALALTTQWMNDHPECAVAAWLMSGIVTEADYSSAGLGHLLQQAKAATHDPEYVQITTEYHKAGGIWDTNKVFTMHEVHSALEQAEKIENKTEIEEVLGGIPWLADAASQCRQRYLENAATAEQTLQAKASLPPVHPDAAQRKDALAEAAAAAAQKMRDEATAKAELAAQRAAEREKALVKEATIEFLRVKFGKKQAPTPAPLIEKLKKACKCHLKVAAGMHLDRCSLGPGRLAATLQRHGLERASIAEQLRKRTSLSGQ
jgi:hypothetical protein